MFIFACEFKCVFVLSILTFVFACMYMYVCYFDLFFLHIFVCNIKNIQP